MRILFSSRFFSLSDDKKITWGDLTSDFCDVLDSRRRSDAGIMTDQWIQNHQNDKALSIKKVANLAVDNFIMSKVRT